MGTLGSQQESEWDFCGNLPGSQDFISPFMCSFGTFCEINVLLQKALLSENLYFLTEKKCSI